MCGACITCEFLKSANQRKHRQIRAELASHRASRADRASASLGRTAVINYRYTIRGLALAGAVAIGSTAALADGVPARAPRAVVEAPFSWTGFYGGANVGAA